VSNTSPKAQIKLPPFHRLALIFPPLTDREYRNLVDNIAAQGLIDDIDLWNGKIIDGVHRAKACQELGIEPKYRERQFKNEEEAREYAKSKNIYRRMLTIKQRLQTLEALLRADSERSNRQLAEETKTDKATVAKVRKRMEDVGEIAHVEKRTDTKGRKQPAAKPKPATKAQPEPEQLPGYFDFAPLQINPEPENKLRATIPALTDREILQRFGIKVEDLSDTEIAKGAKIMRRRCRLGANEATRDKAAAEFREWRAVVDARVAREQPAAKPKPTPAPVPSASGPDPQAYTDLRDFAFYTIKNINDDYLKLTGDPERLRKWRDLKDRVEPLIEAATLIKAVAK
jgi:ParB-like chromosome segregation protein Spo0J